MAAITICRLCASSCESYVKVFEPEGEDLHLSAKIRECLQISLKEEDLLPKIVCLSCCAKVAEFFDFFASCNRAQTSLNNDLFSPNQKFEQLNDGKDVLITEVIETETPKTLEISDETDADKQKKVQDLKDDFSSDEDVFNEEPKNKKVFENYIWKCSECQSQLTTLHAFKTHYKEVHNKSPVYQCQTCTKMYENYRSFARHVKLHSDSRRYSCKICGKRFSLKTVLRSHSTVHSEERPHVCSQCGKAFKQFSSLYLHSKCHLPEQAKPKFPCQLCDKVFSSKHTMETHMKIHTGERNFICDICGKSFIAKGSLDYHISGHSEMKPHACTVCGKGFKTARLLSKHATLHTGVKPHQCDVCGKQFRERSALKEHNRIHTGAMPYSCQFCGKAFRFKGILTVHIRQHTGERPYSCKECKRDFTNWANYNKHMKRRHKTVEQKEVPAPVEVVQQPVVNDSPPISIEPDSLVVEYADELFISMPGRYNYHYLNPILTTPMQNVVLQRNP